MSALPGRPSKTEQNRSSGRVTQRPRMPMTDGATAFPGWLCVYTTLRQVLEHRLDVARRSPARRRRAARPAAGLRVSAFGALSSRAADGRSASTAARRPERRCSSRSATSRRIPRLSSCAVAASCLQPTPAGAPTSLDGVFCPAYLCAAPATTHTSNRRQSRRKRSRMKRPRFDAVSF